MASRSVQQRSAMKTSCDGLVDPCGIVQEGLSFSDRQLVVTVDGEPVPNIEDRVRVLVDEWDDREIAVADCREVTRSIARVVQRMGPSVGCRKDSP